MSDPNEVFRAKIVTDDEGSGPALAKLKAGLIEAKNHAHNLNHELAHVEHESVWHRLREHVTEAHHSFGELGEKVKGVHESISELVPAIGAFAAVGSLAGLFETVEHTSEAYAEMAHTAESLGMHARELQVWNAVAKLTDTSAEGMDKSMSKLNRTLADVTSGKNKEAASLFKHLHLDPHKFHDAADALPALADAFARTTDAANHNHAATMRARMAFTLFGKAGVDMIPMLMKGGDGLREKMNDASKLTFSFRGYEEGLDHYNESMKKLGISVGAFTDELGAKLAPVLQPVIDGMQDWVTANRDWITTDIADEVHELSDWIKGTNWQHISDKIGEWAGDARWFTDEIGGAKTAVELLGAAWAASTAISFLRETMEVIKLGREVTGFAVKLVSELVPAWQKVGDAAAIAGSKEEAATAIGGGGPTGPGGPRFGLNGAVLGLNLAHLYSQASEGVPISKDSLREDPHLAAQLTPEQIAKLPEHGGWRTGDTGNGQSFVGSELQKVWDWASGRTHTEVGSVDLNPPKWSVPGPQETLHAVHSMSFDTDGLEHRPVMIPAGRLGNDHHGEPITVQEHARNQFIARHERDRQYSPMRLEPTRVEVSGQATVTVNIPNLPPGSTATATGGGILAAPKVNLGQAFHDHYSR